MPKNVADNNLTIGEVVFSWSVKEYEQYVRDRRWYLVAGGIAAILLIYAVLSANYLFALIVILFAIVMSRIGLQSTISLLGWLKTTGYL